MPETEQFIAVAGAIVALQFIAAIIGPGALKFLSSLGVLAAGGMAGYLLYRSNIETYPADAQADVDLAIKFGLVALGILIAYLIIRGLFRAMARASAA